MARRRKTQQLIETCREILMESHPMTVRQVYYQLVSRQAIKNSRSQYQAVSRVLKQARLEGYIPWDWIEDRLRRPRRVPMWADLSEFAETCRESYRLDVWSEQPEYLEVWLEKDALSGIFEEILQPYGVTLCVGRGYDGWSSIHEAASRWKYRDSVTVLYFGDFDPSGEDMARSLEERLGILDCHPTIIKCALTRDDIDRYRLPPDFAKTTDTITPAFVEKYGDISVELDALPIAILKKRITQEVTSRLDMAAIDKVRQQEAREREQLVDALSEI